MPLKLEKFSGSGSTPKRRKFWDKIVEAILLCQKIPGKNVSVDVHEGYGSVINVNPQRAKSPSGECIACPPDSVTVTLSDVTLCTGCIVLGGIGEGLSAVLSAGSVNGTYSVPMISSEPCCYEGDFATGITADLYSDTGCTEFFTTLDLAINIWVGRTAEPDCKWMLFAWLAAVAGFDELAIFRGEPQSAISPFSNALVCAGGHDIFNHVCSVREYEGVGADGGTATIA